MDKEPATRNATRVTLTVHVRDGSYQTLVGLLCRIASILLKEGGVQIRSGRTPIENRDGDCLAMMETIDR